MREMKFRAWDKIDNTMIKDILETPSRYSFATGPDPFKFFLDQPLFCVMQYTGLKDKNGVEIYEGDVVSYSEHYIGDHRYSSGKGVIKFDNGGFYISESELSPELCREEIENEHIEIIGNIYEDSELVDK